MTDKRFEVVMNEFDEVEYIMDKAMMEDRDFAEFIDFVEDVCKENEQLQQQIADLENSFDICKHYKETYGDEIVHIKHTIKDMLETERTELGRSVLKQLWSAIQ